MNNFKVTVKQTPAQKCSYTYYFKNPPIMENKIPSVSIPVIFPSNLYMNKLLTMVLFSAIN